MVFKGGQLAAENKMFACFLLIDNEKKAYVRMRR